MQSSAYQECTKLAATDPTKALAKADEWMRIDGSIPAYHCRAMALFGLQRFDEAAATLEQVREKIALTDIALQTYITEQTAKAYVSAGKSDAALQTLTRQIDFMGKNKTVNIDAAKLSAQLLIARARIRTNFGQLNEAVKDLDHAVSLTPLNAQALYERALVFQQLGDIPLSAADAQSVLKLEPTNEKAKTLLKQLGEKKLVTSAPTTAPISPTPVSAVIAQPVTRPAPAPVTTAPAPTVRRTPAENPPPAQRQ